MGSASVESGGIGQPQHRVEGLAGRLAVRWRHLLIRRRRQSPEVGIRTDAAPSLDAEAFEFQCAEGAARVVFQETMEAWADRP